MALSENSAMVSPTTTISVDGDREKRFSVEEDPLPTASAAIPLSAVAHTPGDQSSVQGTGGKTPPKGHSGVTAPLEIPKWRFMAIFGSLMISVFLFALDQLIVATAIPKITAEFNSLTQLSWLTSGFFLTLLSFNLLYSQLMNIFPSKHVIIFAVFIFEMGSLACGVAPNMNILIFGRALAGAGAAGIFSGGMVIIAELTPLHSRAQYFALFGVCFAIASVVGPLIGGAFSDHVSWRWCFYINLPLGGVAIGCLLFFQPSRPPLGRESSYKGYSKAMLKQLLMCDWVGVVLSMAWAVCFILGTQWGGVTRSWDSASVIVTLVFAGVLPIAFCLYEYFVKESISYFRIRLFKRRTVAGAAIVSFCVFGIFMILVYYLSLTFQAVHGTSATSAGVKLLPLILVQVFVLILTSRIIPKIGRFKPVICVGPVFLAIASGLFYSTDYSTPIANLYGYQVILAVGIGCCLQNVMVAVQHDLKKEPWLISLGTGLVVFTGFAGRIVALSMSGSVFENMIQRHLKAMVPGISEEIISAVVNDATAVWTSVPEDLREPVLRAYTKTLSQVFIIGLPLSIIALVGALAMKNDKMATKEEEEKGIADAKAAQQAKKDEETGVSGVNEQGEEGARGSAEGEPRA
ncbi:aflatoxin efflux pump AFLT [Cryptococcus neoformans Bt120]|nr:aflatoxin efflux pump AFLT [Cryptococcus neoformans var. grubii Bt120]